MKKSVIINFKSHNIELITNGKEDFDNVVICFHGFNGDKWGDAYSGLKRTAENSLVCSFDSCGHGNNLVPSDKMRLDIMLEEIDVVIKYIKNEVPEKPIILVAVSYGAYRVMQYLLKYNPKIEKVIYVNPAFRMLETLEFIKDFKYSELKKDELVLMKRSLNKYMHKSFLDDLYVNNLYTQSQAYNYDTVVVVGIKDTLIPINDTLQIVKKYNLNLSYVDDAHCFANKDNWNVVVNKIKDIR